MHTPNSLRLAATALGVLAVTGQAVAARSLDVRTADTGTADAVAVEEPACADLEVAQSLLAHGDANWYFLAPGGSFRTGAADWTVDGDARVVRGDWSGGPSADAAVLELAPGATATSPVTCANRTTPSFRFFVRSAGEGPGLYTVRVTYVTPSGDRVGAAASASAGTAWDLSPEFRLTGQRITAEADGWAAVRISVTAPEDAPLRIDDLHIDPRMR
jgi:hypothetical protein